MCCQNNKEHIIADTHSRVVNEVWCSPNACAFASRAVSSLGSCGSLIYHDFNTISTSQAVSSLGSCGSLIYRDFNTRNYVTNHDIIPFHSSFQLLNWPRKTDNCKCQLTAEAERQRGREGKGEGKGGGEGGREGEGEGEGGGEGGEGEREGGGGGGEGEGEGEGEGITRIARKDGDPGNKSQGLLGITRNY